MITIMIMMMIIIILIIFITITKITIIITILILIPILILMNISILIFMIMIMQSRQIGSPPMTRPGRGLRHGVRQLLVGPGPLSERPPKASAVVFIEKIRAPLLGAP